MTSKRQIVAQAVELLSTRPEGLRYSELLRSVHEALPHIPENTVHGTLWNLHVQEPDQVYKPARGLFLHAKFREAEPPEESKPSSPASRKGKFVTKKIQIIARAVELLSTRPEGIRYSELMRLVHEALPYIPKNTVVGTLWNLHVQEPNQVYKPATGLFFHAKFREAEPPKPPPPEKEKVIEKAFYKPFADWLVNELEECTRAIPVGGSSFKDKWGTPDVVGIREPKKSDIIQFPTEIISAEIKLDSASLITAFGQACAYRLFSHKSYIVVPTESLQDDIGRLDTLSRIFGIGLILFNAKDPQSPNFEIRVRATRQEPDMFYVNYYLKRIEDELFG